MFPRLNVHPLSTLLFAFILFSGFFMLTAGDNGIAFNSAFAEEQEEYCPPELCEEEVVEEDIDEDCPPEFCDEVVEEEVDEDCPPEFCDEAVDESGDEAVYEEETEEERPPVDRTLYSRLTGAMRDTMYQHVTDDEEIDAVEQWILDGRKNDAVFTDTIRPIMKENCSKCHSTSSTMTKGNQELPLTTYEEIVAFTKLAPADSACLECHANESLNQHLDEKLATIYLGKGVKEHSAHKDVPCIRCHFDLHKEQDSYCQDSKAFTGFLDSWKQGAAFNCTQTQKPDCVKCHIQIGDKIAESVHFEQDDHEVKLLDKKGDPLKAPSCIDCHSTHDAVISKQDKTSLMVVEGCGNCHADMMDSYFESYHGKAARLGSEDSAKCFSCHGSHEMVPLKDEKSLVHELNREETCKECHEDTNKNFAGFMPHADHTDGDKYPILNYAYLAMSGLLLSVCVAFGIHTALWFYRTRLERKQFKAAQAGQPQDEQREPHVRRFKVSHTLLHLLVVISFLALGLSGMTLKFADNVVFQWVSDALGGPANLALIHRVGAVMTGAYFALHLLQLLVMLIKREITFAGLFSEHYTMIPLMRDVIDIKDNMLYFVGKGPKPSFGRWTYWEKFDYMAVFWGVAVIGISGLVLWFPEVTTQFIPGWSINIAAIVHGEEALLATLFIFIVHFFHTHMGSTPVSFDPVVFTQRMPLSHFKAERPLEYQQMVERGELNDNLLSPPSKWYLALVTVFGFSARALGLLLVLAIIYSLIFL